MKKKLHEHKKMSRLRKLTIKSIWWNAITKIIICFYTQQFSGGIKWLCDGDQRLYTQTVTDPKGLMDITEKLRSKKPFKCFDFDSFVTLRIFGQKNASTIYGAYRIRKKALEFFDMSIQQCRSAAVKVEDPSLKEIVTKLGRNLTGLQKTVGIGGGALLGGVGLYALHKKREHIKELFSKGVFDLRDIFTPQEAMYDVKHLLFRIGDNPTILNDWAYNYEYNNWVESTLDRIIKETCDPAKATYENLRNHLFTNLSEMTGGRIYNFWLVYLQNKYIPEDRWIITWLPAENPNKNQGAMETFLVAFSKLLYDGVYVLEGEDLIYVPEGFSIDGKFGLALCPVVSRLTSGQVHLNYTRRLEKWFNEDGSLNENRLTGLEADLQAIVGSSIFATS